MIVAALLLGDERLSAIKLTGVIIGFSGVALTIGLDSLRSFDIRSLAQLVVLLAGFFYSLVGVWAELRLAEQSSVMNTLGMLLGSSVLMIPTALRMHGLPSFNLMRILGYTSGTFRPTHISVLSVIFFDYQASRFRQPHACNPNDTTSCHWFRDNVFRRTIAD